MPITGLPDPTIHRKCKRCGTWCHLHEGSLAWPPKRGLLSLVHVALAESLAREGEQKFYCAACLERNARDERSFRKAAGSLGISLLALAVLAPIAWATGLIGWIEAILRGG